MKLAREGRRGGAEMVIKERGGWATFLVIPPFFRGKGEIYKKSD